MPATTAAFLAGEINSDHVDLLSGANRPWRDLNFADAEADLVGQCDTPWFSNAVKVIEYWKQLADREAAEDGADVLREGRHATISTGWRGEVNLTARFHPIGGVAFENELHRLTEQLRLSDERDGTVRTLQQRRVDALVEMAVRSRTAPADGLRPRPMITITVGIEPFNRICELANGTVIAPGQLVPLLTEAEIERIVYDPPNRKIQASHRRRFTGALRRVIEVRDRHCQHASGCDVPASHCDVDHIIPHSQGGITCICNGKLACTAHNRIPTLRNPTPRVSTGCGPRPRPPTLDDDGTDNDAERHQQRPPPHAS